ncbi:MAG TPA: SDR family NAD(P)-dependent oxidoreductase [Xanthobacteraceae bacterium]|nr:SDR family NAD(P)-dependent oxidoreductase [Xanthobacteraceae bacterium]
MKLEGKTALITGGASGIGKATVMEFARSGARVICADIDAKKGTELEKEAAAAKLSVEYAAVDLSDSASARRCAAEALKRHPRIDILVNAAGWGDMQAFVDNKPDYIDRLVAINLSGPLHLTQALLPAMIAAGKGKIISVASDAGRVGSTGETVYAAAKGGIIAFTKSLAREVARYSINVNCVCPGPTDTPMLMTRPEKIREAFLRATPFRRFAKPQEIADAILFFASPRSDYITGQILSVSGGLTFAG